MPADAITDFRSECARSLRVIAVAHPCRLSNRDRSDVEGTGFRLVLRPVVQSWPRFPAISRCRRGPGNVRSPSRSPPLGKPGPDRTTGDESRGLIHVVPLSGEGIAARCRRPHRSPKAIRNRDSACPASEGKIPSGACSGRRVECSNATLCDDGGVQVLFRLRE